MHSIHLRNIYFSWNKKPPEATDEKFELKIDAWQVETGETIFIHGPSGTGKSTFLGLIGGVLTPARGQLFICGGNVTTMSPGQRDTWRVDHIGFLFQQFNLLPYLPVIENVLLPCRFSAVRRRQALARARSSNPVHAEAALGELARELMRALGLPDHLFSRPVHQLSVGQQQRVAAARALIGAPEIIIADEPTSALDRTHRDLFIDTLLAQCAKQGSTLIFASHDHDLAKSFRREMALSELGGWAAPENPPVAQAPGAPREARRHAH